MKGKAWRSLVRGHIAALAIGISMLSDSLTRPTYA